MIHCDFDSNKLNFESTLCVADKGDALCPVTVKRLLTNEGCPQNEALVELFSYLSKTFSILGSIEETQTVRCIEVICVVSNGSIKISVHSI
jgi:hypothetical protein